MNKGGGAPGVGGVARDAVFLVIELTPYRLFFLERVAREVPEVGVRTFLFPHRQGSAWRLDSPAIRLERFEPARPSGIESVPGLRSSMGLAQALSPRAAWKRVRAYAAERREASRVIARLEAIRPVALVVTGYGGVCEKRAIRWAARQRVAHFVWADSNIYSDRARGWRFKVKRAIVSRLLSRVAGMLPCGSCGREFFLRYYPHPERMYICPAEPDYALIEGTTDARAEAARARFGLAEGRRRIACCCRLVGLKRVDTIVDAFARIAGERPGWDLVIIGDGPERGAIERAIPPAIRGRVAITGFLSDQGVVNALYKSSEVLVHAADNEAWGLVIIEAAASGLAILATRVTGAAHELVREGENGFLFTPGDAGELARLLLEVTRDEVLSPMRAASRRIADAWRRANDPITGLRRAFGDAGVI